MGNLTPNQTIINNDILRYKNNKIARMFALLGLVFNCLYFMLLYAFNALMVNGEPTRFADITIGFSVVFTLVVLLTAFLASEGIKAYNKKYSILLIILAAWQIFRIFGYPLYGLKNNLLYTGYFGFYPTADQSGVEFAILVVYLVASALCFILSAVFGWIYAIRYERFNKQLESGEVNIDATLKAMDAEDERQAANVLSESTVSEEELKLVEGDQNA